MTTVEGRGAPSVRRLLMLWCVLVVVAVFFGCSSNTDPVGESAPSDIDFLPAVGSFEVFPLAQLEFEVRSNPPVSSGICWQLDGQACETETVFQYQALAVGTDTILVRVDQDGDVSSRQWLVFVYPDTTALPGVVPGVVISHGPAVGEIIVSWNWIPASTFPIIEYQVGMSVAGPVTILNWDDATILGRYAHDPGQAGYTALFGPGDHGQAGGTRIWFAVRGVDEASQMSPIQSTYSHVVSYPWLISGTVVDDSLRAIGGVVLDFESGRTNSLADGTYEVGPLSDVFPVDMYSLSRNENIPGQPFSSWYDVSLDGLVVGEVPDPMEIPLVTRWGLAPECPGYENDFLLYLREISNTKEMTPNRSSYRLFKWDHYPVKVHITEYTNGAGLDFTAQARLAVQSWNEAMWDGDYLVEEDDPLAADIVVDFGYVPGGHNGVTVLVEPSDEDYSMGEVIPERVEIMVWDGLPYDTAVQIKTLHELGHALGLAHHALCNDAGYLMYITTDNDFPGSLADAIHIDERRAVRAIRNLPQGMKMDAFLPNKY